MTVTALRKRDPDSPFLNPRDRARRVMDLIHLEVHQLRLPLHLLDGWLGRLQESSNIPGMDVNSDLKDRRHSKSRSCDMPKAVVFK